MVQATRVGVDLIPAAENMVDVAVAVATGRLNLQNPDETRALLAGNDRAALEYFRHELAHQLSMLIMRTDTNVLAVYKEHEIPEAEEFGTPALSLADPLYLVVYSERETAALRSLISALDQVLAEVLSDRINTVRSGLIVVETVNPARSRSAIARARSFRPPPMLLVSRED